LIYRLQKNKYINLLLLGFSLAELSLLNHVKHDDIPWRQHPRRYSTYLYCSVVYLTGRMNLSRSSVNMDVGGGQYTLQSSPNQHMNAEYLKVRQRESERERKEHWYFFICKNTSKVEKVYCVYWSMPYGTSSTNCTRRKDSFSFFGTVGSDRGKFFFLRYRGFGYRQVFLSSVPWVRI